MSLRRCLEPNHDHLSQRLEEGPAPLRVGSFVREPRVYDPAVGREVVQPHKEEVEATYPVRQDERSHSEPYELGETVGDAELQLFFEEQDHFLYAGD